ncbi:hypothetical protein BU16DRAFT_538720 [Lophium mytilinum]|uniref:EamA domain-containing protein n=1 Tax=Lophium mytilinum TaxID=390894 RepID=A0A6A6QWS7_9PEZI|nr:hypothetical protein BU16DRAFT_538720 [Lophium mytilinum]
MPISHPQPQDAQDEGPDETLTSGQPTRERAWRRVYHNNKGVFLILLAQVAGSSMDAIARFLQLGDGGMHPFQIIVARMSVTFVLSSMYMWLTKVHDFPLGKKSVRGLLVLRALFGFFGLWCLYCKIPLFHIIPYSYRNGGRLLKVSLDSVHYLPLAEATVFRFLVPIVTAWACSLLLGAVFSWKDLCAGVLALVGVVIIAHPAALFGDKANSTNMGNPVDEVTTTQRLIAIAISVLGVLGASGAYTMIRVIGDRAHALVSVNYFAFVSTVGSTLILLITPNIGFVKPQGPREWALLSLLGVLGFILQFLLTAGLQLDKSSKATSILYTQVVFALLFDWSIWGVLPGMSSFVGGAIVIASTLWSALQKPQKAVKDTPKTAAVDEETALLGAQIEDVEEAAQRRASTAT